MRIDSARDCLCTPNIDRRKIGIFLGAYQHIDAGASKFRTGTDFASDFPRKSYPASRPIHTVDYTEPLRVTIGDKNPNCERLPHD